MVSGKLQKSCRFTWQRLVVAIIRSARILQYANLAWYAVICYKMYASPLLSLFTYYISIRSSYLVVSVPLNAEGVDEARNLSGIGRMCSSSFGASRWRRRALFSSSHMSAALDQNSAKLAKDNKKGAIFLGEPCSVRRFLIGRFQDFCTSFYFSFQGFDLKLTVFFEFWSCHW